MMALAFCSLACGEDPPDTSPSGTTGGAGAGGSSATTSGSGGGGATATAGTGGYTVPDPDRCSSGPGEVLAVDVWSAELALDADYIYVLASADSSLELSRLPLAGGAPERLATQSLYGFGLGVRDGVVSWLARPELLVMLDEDYVDWNVWTLPSPGAEPSVALQDGVRHLSVGPRGIVNSRIEPLVIQLQGEDGPSDVCPATGVNELASNANLAVWSQWDALFTCSLDDGTQSELAPGDEKTPAGLLVDDEYAYWGSDSDPGVWRAPLAGGAAESLAADVTTRLLGLAGGYLYFAPSTSAVATQIQRVDLGSKAIETVVSEQGNITNLVADATHVYWYEYNSNQFYCLKRAEVP